MRFRFVAVLSLLACTVLAGIDTLRFARRYVVSAQNVNIYEVAKRHPKFTKERQVAMLRELQSEVHPRWQDLSLTQIATRLGKFLAAPAASGAPTPLANFVGNLTGIGMDGGSAAPMGGLLYLQRQNDCSLLRKSASYDIVLSGPVFTSFQNSATTAHYENVLHSAAQLATRPDLFAGGCADQTLGIGSREGVYLGNTSQNLYMFAAVGYVNTHGSNGLYYGTLNSTTNAVSSFNIDVTDPYLSAVAGGDLNGDGLADVVGVDGYPGGVVATISVRLAHPDGSLSAPSMYSLPGTIAEAAVIDDVNGDGKADVVVATRNNSTGQEYLSVMTGKGDGTLNSATTINVATTNKIYIENLITADLRNSGHKDIVTSNGIVLLNDGTGKYTASSASAFTAAFASSSYGPNLAAGDLNGDKKLDLVVNNGGTVAIYLGNGDGTFKPGPSYSSNDSIGYVTITDLDGDGNSDVYVGLANGGFFGGDQFQIGQAYALMGNGDGTLRGASDAPFVYNGANLADLNGDKILDGVGVSASLTANTVSFVTYAGKGDGTFVAKSTLPVPPVTSAVPFTCTYNGIDSFALGDINNDGKADLVFFATNNGSPCFAGFFTAMGKGDGTFSTPVFTFAPALRSGTPFYSQAVSNISLSDINHDGKTDIVYVYLATDAQGITYQGVAVQLSNGDGSFQAPKLAQTSVNGSANPPPSPSVELLGDVNGDGYPDLFLLQGSAPVCGVSGCGPVAGYQFEMLLGKGDGTFGAPTNMPANPSVSGGIVSPFSQVAVADMNGDGHMDIIALSSITVGGIGIYLGKGDGTFASPIDVDNAGEGLAIADFNGDGKLDIAVTGLSKSGIFLGNGDGTVQSSTDSSGDLLPAQTIIFTSFDHAVAADLNGDGKTDVLSGSLVLLSPATITSSSLATTTNLAASASTVSAGQNITFSVNVMPSSGSGFPSGFVTFYDGSVTLGTATLSGGSTSLSTSALGVGTHSLTASYGGDNTYNSSVSSNAIVTVTAVPVVVPTTTTVVASAANVTVGTQIVLTATVAPASGSGVATSAVTFYDGTTILGSSTLSNGKTTYTSSTFTTGSHSITAHYAGDVNDGSSISTALTITVTASAADFSLGFSQPSATVSAGNSITSSLTVTPVGGFNQQVSLACSGAPLSTTCSINPAAITLNGSSASTATVTIQTNVKLASMGISTLPGEKQALEGSFTMGMTTCGLLGLCLVRKRSCSLAYLRISVIGVVFILAALTGCGGSKTSNATPAGTSTITVTGTSGLVTHSATYNLIVQ